MSTFNIQPFGEQDAVQISRQELSEIIEARVEEIFSMVVQEIKRSGYDGLLPAGMVLTGGSSATAWHPRHCQPGIGGAGAYRQTGKPAGHDRSAEIRPPFLPASACSTGLLFSAKWPPSK